MDPKIQNPGDLGKSIAVYKTENCLGKFGNLYADINGNVIVPFFKANSAISCLLVEFRYDTKTNMWYANNEYPIIS